MCCSRFIMCFSYVQQLLEQCCRPQENNTKTTWKYPVHLYLYIWRKGRFNSEFSDGSHVFTCLPNVMSVRLSTARNLGAVDWVWRYYWCRHPWRSERFLPTTTIVCVVIFHLLDLYVPISNSQDALTVHDNSGKKAPLTGTVGCRKLVYLYLDAINTTDNLKTAREVFLWWTMV